jgi:two-component system, NarL family, response regulator
VDSPETIRILLVDDHPIVREGLRALIDRRPNMAVVAEASNGREAVEEFARHRPHVVLMDLRMPELDGVEAITAIIAEAPGARIVVLTTYDADEDIYRAIRAGAKGYILKDAPREMLMDCIRAVHAGRTFIPEAVASRLADHLAVTELSPRELEILRHVADGQANKRIATDLGIAEGTVKSHMNSVLQKLGAGDRTQAVTIALRRGIIRLS